MLSLLLTGLFSQVLYQAPPTLEYSPAGDMVLVEWQDNGNALPILGIIDNNGQMLHKITSPTGQSARMGSWSSTGNAVLFLSHNTPNVYFLQSSTYSSFPVDIIPPICWTGNDGFLGVTRENLMNYVSWVGLANKKILNKHRAETGDIKKMLWIELSNGAAFIKEESGKTNIFALEYGEYRAVTTTGDIFDAQTVKNRSKLVWSRKSPNLKYILTSLWEYDLRLRTVHRLPLPDRVNLINPTPQQSPSSVDAIAVSPECKKVLIIARFTEPDPQKRGSMKTRISLFVLNIDGSNAKLVRTIDRANVRDILQVAWSPNERNFAVLEKREKSLTLDVYNSDGTGQKRVFYHQL